MIAGIMHVNKNVDQHEINKFDQMAEQWWDTSGPMKPLHQLNPLRLNFIKQHATVSNKKIVDIGCGGGILSEALARDGGLVTGIDQSEDALEAAKQHAKTHQVNLDYLAITAEEFSRQQAEQFDVVTCLEMLEHVPEPASVVQACAQLLKPGGKVFFSTLNRNLKSFLMAIVGAEYVLNLLPRGTHEYAKFLKPSEINQFAESAKLQLVELTGIHYNPIMQSFKLKSNVDVNYICCYEKKS